MLFNSIFFRFAIFTSIEALIGGGFPIITMPIGTQMVSEDATGMFRPGSRVPGPGYDARTHGSYPRELAAKLSLDEYPNKNSVLSNECAPVIISPKKHMNPTGLE